MKNNMRSPSEIVQIVRKVPTNPDDTLNSRRGQTIEIRGDAVVFALEEHTTNPEFIKAMREAQQELYGIIERDLNLEGKTWSDKESRHRDKRYKKQKQLHLAFFSTIPPSGFEEYKEKKDLQTSEQIKRAGEVLYQFVNQGQIIFGNVKECKLNPDGHIVVRINIDPVEKLINCKEELTKIFGFGYTRYTDPEKQRTLAAVICVVDFSKLSTSAKEAVESVIIKLEKKLKLIPNIPLKTIEWIDYRKRTLSEKNRLNIRTFTRTREDLSLLIYFLMMGGGMRFAFSSHNKSNAEYDSKPKYSERPTIIRKQYLATKKPFSPRYQGQSHTLFSSMMTRKAVSFAQRAIRGLRIG